MIKPERETRTCAFTPGEVSRARLRPLTKDLAEQPRPLVLLG